MHLCILPLPQIVFRKRLSFMQWFSLILLTTGCIINRLDFSALFSNSAEGSSFTFRLHPFMLLILLQAVCSCLAGVYNEYILKHQGADVNIYVQNAYMYIDSIAANVFFLSVAAVFGGENVDESPATQTPLISSIWQPVILVVMLNNACIGIVTSFFLKYLNSILKTFASALELVFTALLCYLLFDIAITLNTVLSILVVSLAIYLYSCAPVNNTKKKEKKEALLNDDDVEAEEV